MKVVLESGVHLQQWGLALTVGNVSKPACPPGCGCPTPEAAEGTALSVTFLCFTAAIIVI